VYGQTKLEGEQLVQTGCQRHLILRTSWVYAARGSNFAKTMLGLAAEREELTVVDDQIGAPTGAELLADTTALVLRELERQPQLAGLYHLSAQGQTSWHGYACHVIEQARQIRPEKTFKVRQIKPVKSSAFQTAARRPHNSRLDTRRLMSTFGLTLPPWQQGVDRMLREIL
jgi:dTDP-4-dehydrorhamnose reductase